MFEKFFTVKHISKILGVKQATIYGWIRDGKLKATKVNNRRGYTIMRKDLESFVDAHPAYLSDYYRYKKTELIVANVGMVNYLVAHPEIIGKFKRIVEEKRKAIK